jgi:enolase-phosphatase E1
MIHFAGKLVLLDIEGTVSDLAFVHQVLFPYARREVSGFLALRAGDAVLAPVLDQMARDDGAPDFAAWCPEPAGSLAAADWVASRAQVLMDADAKLTGLKTLQGLIWDRGFREGVLRAPLFADVPDRLNAWKRAGKSIRIYSSGSIAAQKLFFGFSVAGDLSPLLDGFFDTTTGPKRSSESYQRIALESGVAPEEILFLSDVVEELDAAAGAGLGTALVVRPGNRPATTQSHPRINSLDEIAT